jgi:hypothetical protein
MNPNLNPRTNALPPNRRLTSAQIYLLEMYNLQYNELIQQINARYIDATNIRNNMNAIIATTFPNVSINTTNTTPTANQNFPALNSRIHSPLRTRAPGGLYSPSDFPASWLRNNSFNSFFDNVIVSPSTEQINTSTRTLRFGDIETPINDRCPISFETFTPEDNVLQIIHCGHIFNPCEIAVWFRSNVGCPVCRYDIRNHNQGSHRPLNTSLPSTSNMEETKEDNGDQEFKEAEPTPINAPTNANARANDNVDSNTEALIEALLYVLMPGTTGRQNNATTASTTSTASNTSNTSSISYDPSNNMFFFDYYLGRRS